MKTIRRIAWVVSIIMSLTLIPLAKVQFGKTGVPKFYSDFKPGMGS
jgi:hypothetical protein